MITSPTFAGKRYAVLGLARSGVATVEALLASGATVVAWDSDETKRNALYLPGTGRGTADEVGGGGGSPPGDPSAETPLHHAAHGPPPRSGEVSNTANTRLLPPLPLAGEGLGESLLLSPSSRAPEEEKALTQPSPAKAGEGSLSFADPLTIDLTGFAAVIVSPGVPLNRHPIKSHADSFAVPVIGDIELFAQARASLPPHKVVGITGTNGKSTTTALIHHILQTAGVPSLMGGNIGLPILGRDPLPEGGVYVLELSSYQLDLTFTLDCDVAVLTNITPDHLDRYDGFKAYAASKARLFEMQATDRKAVFAGADEPTSALCNEYNRKRSGRVMWVDNSFEEILGVSVFNGAASIYGDVVAHQKDWPTLPGPHNAENAGAAIAACYLLGVPTGTIAQALRTYPGLPHRMERVATKAGVLYVNDSKATNSTATAPALGAYKGIHWILGGRAKTDELDACEPYFPNVRAAYTIGEAGPMFANLLRPHLPVTESGTLAQAVQDAAAAARAGEVVMLSPACASFDQFKDYEARGDAFRTAVEALPDA